MSDIKTIDVRADIIETNDTYTKEVRAFLKEHNTYLINLMASPGAGKTTTLIRTINALKDRYRIGVMEADMDSDVDAKLVSETGAKVIQLHTGGLLSRNTVRRRNHNSGILPVFTVHEFFNRKYSIS